MAADRRYERRALAQDELTRLIAAAERGLVVLGVRGPERAMVYRLAAGTGFRASELRSLLEAARAVWLDEASTPAEREERERSDFLQYADHVGRVADFHALRHTYISDIVGSGASVKVA